MSADQPEFVAPPPAAAPPEPRALVQIASVVLVVAVALGWSLWSGAGVVPVTAAQPTAAPVAVVGPRLLRIQRPPRVSIEVRDTGPGVPAALRERVFEKFFRVENLQAGSGNGARGAGIGLFLCRQIVALHSGTIECTAPDTGSGAWFRVSLPAGGRAGARSEG